MSQRSSGKIPAAGLAAPSRRERRVRSGIPAALLGLATLVAAVIPVSAAVQMVSALGARIDWATGEVRVTAAVPAPEKSKPETLKAAALSQAQGNLRKLLAQLGKGGGVTYAIPEDAAKQAALAKTAKVVSAGPVAGGRYQVVLAVALPGAASGATDEAPQSSSAPSQSAYTDPDPARVRTFPAPPPTGEESLLTPANAGGPFTGIIVDARSFSLRNAMSPRLLDAAFRDVYNGAHASVDYVEDVGVVGYMGSIAAALKNPRVGSRPLVVRAIGVGDAHKTCPVISLEDAKRFLNDAGAKGIISRCAVCFIIDALASRDR